MPFYAYHGVTLLKSAYDDTDDKAAGAGIHLYSYTGRGEDGSGLKDWRSFLPAPAPYSAQPALVPGAAELCDLYEKGETAGIIMKNNQGSYVVLETAPVSVPDYQLGDFQDGDGNFLSGKLDELRTQLQKELEEIHQPGMGQKEILLKNDGDSKLGEKTVHEVRRDYFLHYPKLQEVVRQELAKRDALQKGIDALDAIESDFKHYREDLELFSDLLFYGILPCTDGAGNPVYSAKISRIIYTYTDPRGLEVQQIFTRDGEADMPYSRSHPLYQAFLTYRSLPADAQPRQEMDEKVRERQKELLQQGDNLIGYQLEQVWNTQSLNKLNKELAYLPTQEKNELMRFYLGLVSCIGLFRDKFSHADWTYQPAQTVQPAPSAQPKVWTVYDNGRYLYVYESNLSYGWDQGSSQWVALTTAMQVWNPASNSWMPLTPNPNGGFYLP